MKGCQKAGCVRRSRRKQISKGKAPRHVQGTFVYERLATLSISLSPCIRKPLSDFCGEIEESYLLVYHFYLPMERADIDTKILSARCPLADVLCSACGTPPLCHLGLTATLHVCIYPLPYASMTPFLMGADWSVSMKEKKLGMRGEAPQIFPP
jgi:hypothetical protein